MLTLHVSVLFHLIKAVMIHSHARIVEVEAVPWSDVTAWFQSLQVGIYSKSMEHWIGKWLNKRVAAMTMVRKVISNIKWFSHAEMFFTVLPDFHIPRHSLFVCLHKLHVKFIQIT